MSTRPKAKWKVEYEAKVKGLSNADLLSEALELHASKEWDMADSKDDHRAKVAVAELTRRLRDIGWLPSEALSWDDIQPIEQANIKLAHLHFGGKTLKDITSAKWRYIESDGKPGFWDMYDDFLLTSPPV